MSGFDMALLEGKDRAELAAIAEQLGQKPGARAKKADIIALITKLVGADGGDEAASEAEAPAEAEGRSDERGARRRSKGPEGAPTDASANGAAAPDERDGADGAEAADAADADETPTAGDVPAEGGPEGPGDGQREGAARERGERQRGGQPPQGGQPQQGGESQQGGEGQRQGGEGQRQGGEGEGDGEPEPGNRRRRRRGRDRRDDDQQPVEPVEVEGMVDLREEGYGFLRVAGYLPSRDDAYISVKQTRQFGLRTGDTVRGKSRPAGRNEKNPALLQVDAVNGHQAHNQPPRPRFEELTAVFPDEQLRLETDDPTNVTARAIDLLAPIGKGQRGLIVAPPRAGKTTILKDVVRSIETNHPDVELIVVLIDERPEEVTEMQRWLLHGSVAASTFDRPADEHIAVAELVIERAKRMVETGRDVVVVLDGLTRLARAYNLAAPADGRSIGGLDTTALHAPKRLFGAARNAEEGGSLTILATIATGTGSALDEAIFEEFQGTETMELALDRRLADRRTFPAIDVEGSSTRQEGLLLDDEQAPQVAKLRDVLAERIAAGGSNAAGLELLLERIAATKTNADLLAEVAKP